MLYVYMPNATHDAPALHSTYDDDADGVLLALAAVADIPGQSAIVDADGNAGLFLDGTLVAAGQTARPPL